MRQEWQQGVWTGGRGYVMLDVTAHITSLVEMEVDGQKLLPKPEYHCTLVAAPKFTDKEDEQKRAIDLTRTFLKTHQIRFRSLGEDRYICRKNDDITVIAPCIIDGLDDLTDELQKTFAKYSQPFPHVTLLKSENSLYGIGVDSNSDLNSYCKKIV